jgi:hypothetical protein
MKKQQLALLVLTTIVSQLGMPLANAATIAVIDSGIRPVASLAGRVDPGVDFVDGNQPPQDETSVRHGTTVSQIAANQHSANRILPVRVLDAAGFTSEQQLVQGINYSARSHARVLNLSIGSPSNSGPSSITSALQRAAAANKVVVLAAGNQGLSSPTFPGNLAKTLSGAGIVVGALAPNGNIAGYSNRAGTSRSAYVLAPGFSAFSNFVGTSIASPYVSGTAAAILAQNPRLTAVQVAQIIFTTADDLGAPGVDAIYGHGRLNAATALSAQGEVTVPDSDGGSSGVGAAALAIGAGIGAALIYKNKKLKETLVLDQYERPYMVDLGSLSHVRDDSLGLDGLMQSLKQRTEYSDLEITDSLTLGIWYGEDELQRFERETTGQLDSYEQDWSLSLQQGGETGAYYALNMNLDPRQFFGAADEISPYAVFDRRSLTAPYAGFAASGNMALTGYRTDSGRDLRLGVISMDDDEEYGVSSRSMLFEGITRPHPRLKLGVQVSALSEQGSLFGGSSGGALSVNHAETLATGLLAGFKLTSRLSLQMLYSQGFTWVDDSNKSLLGDFSGLRSDSYAVGLQGRGVLTGSDSIGLSVSRPLHVNAGSLNLNVPGDINVYTGDVSFNSETIDLAGTRRETDLELGYHLPMGKQTGFASYLRYRHDPTGLLNESGNGRYGVMMSVSSRF